MLTYVSFSGEGMHSTIMFNKIFDAPKYMIERYVRGVMKNAGGVSRVSKSGEVFYGYRKGDRLPYVTCVLERHTLRDRHDPLLQKESA